MISAGLLGYTLLSGLGIFQVKMTAGVFMTTAGIITTLSAMIEKEERVKRKSKKSRKSQEEI